MASGSRHSMGYVPEVTYGLTPATPAFKNLRHTSASLALSKELLESEELRSDRQTTDSRHGAFQVGGDLGFELSYGSYDDLLAALMGGTWTTQFTTGLQSLSATVGTVVRATGSFVTDGFLVGSVVENSGFTIPGNNGRFVVTAVAALILTLTPLQGQTMAVEVAAAGKQVISRASISVGNTRRSFTFERFFSDILPADKPYHRFTGVEVNSLELAIAANAMTTGTFTFIGQNQSTATAIIAGATYPVPTTTAPLDSFSGTLNEGGTTIGVITEIQLNIENSLEPRFVVGSKASLQPSIGRAMVSGQITAYFDDSRLLDKFINETESSIDLSMPDAAGNVHRIFLPRVKYNSGQPDVSGEGPITLSMPFKALRSALAGNTIFIER